VIPVKDALEYLDKCILSLKKYTNKYELIIIDNGSRVKTRDYISRLKAKVITNKENMGFSYACNQGIKASSNDYICFLNSDTVVTPNWLYYLQKCFKLNPDCGIASPTTCFSGGKQCDHAIMDTRFDMTEQEILEYALKLNEGYIISDIFGFCMLTKKSILDKVGGFDYKRYGLGNSEEKDIIWRLEQVGYNNYWAKQSYVHHYGHKTFDGMKLSPMNNLHKNRAILEERKKDPNLYVDNDVLCEVAENKIAYSKKTDVIIPVLDRPWATIKTLDSLFENNKNINVIIIDNGSESLEYLKDYKVTIIVNNENIGVVKALNQGLELVKSKYVVLMHNDIEVNTKGWIDKAVKFMDANDKAGMVGVAGWRGLDGKGWYKRTDLVTAIDKYDQKPHSDFEEVAILDGCCSVVRNNGVRFDENYGLMHFYDLDFSMQYRTCGHKLFVINGSAIHFAEDRKKSTIVNSKYTDLVGTDDRKVWEEKNNIFKNKWSVFLPLKLEPIPILMITWDRLEFTKKAIEAIRNNTRYPYILWIWDNGSTDGTVEYLKGLKDKDIVVNFKDKNYGLVPPMNEFFKTFSSYEYVSKVDNDTIVPKDWLTKLKYVMDNLPLFVIQSDHYLGLPYKLKDNQEFYDHLERLEFEGDNLYLFPHVSGTGVLIRNEYMDGDIKTMPGTLSGWVNYQFDMCRCSNRRCAFYDGVWVDRLDFAGTNKVIDNDTEYRDKINMMRSGKIKDTGFGFKSIPVGRLATIKESMRVKWYA